MSVLSFITVVAATPVAGPGRFGANVALVIGLGGVVLAVLALRRPATAAGRLGTIAAAPLGLVAVALGGVHIARTADLGLGTGNGLAGGVAAVVLGLVTVLLGAVAWAGRTRVRPG